MRLGLSLGLSRQDSSFNPLSGFFSPTDEGYFLDFTRADTLFQNVAGTTPVTASGQNMGSVRDLFKGRLLATPAGAVTSLPKYDETGGWESASFAVDDYWQIGTLNLSAYNNVVICGFLRKNSDAAVGTVVEHTAVAASTAGGFAVSAAGGAGTASIRVQSRGASALSSFVYTNAAIAAGQTFFFMTVMNTNTRNQLWIENTMVAESTTAQGGGNYAGPTTHNIGLRNGATVPFNGMIRQGFALCASTAPKTDTQLAQMRAYFLARRPA
jgi:hypothetical protein